MTMNVSRNVHEGPYLRSVEKEDSLEGGDEWEKAEGLESTISFRQWLNQPTEINHDLDHTM
jgi:hypothetical protein